MQLERFAATDTAKIPIAARERERQREREAERDREIENMWTMNGKGVNSWPSKLEFDTQNWPGDFFKSKLRTIPFSIFCRIFHINLSSDLGGGGVECVIFIRIKFKAKIRNLQGRPSS